MSEFQFQEGEINGYLILDGTSFDQKLLIPAAPGGYLKRVG